MFFKSIKELQLTVLLLMMMNDDDGDTGGGLLDSVLWHPAR